MSLIIAFQLRGGNDTNIVFPFPSLLHNPDLVLFVSQTSSVSGPYGHMQKNFDRAKYNLDEHTQFRE